MRDREEGEKLTDGEVEGEGVERVCNENTESWVTGVSVLWETSCRTEGREEVSVWREEKEEAHASEAIPSPPSP